MEIKIEPVGLADLEALTTLSRKTFYDTFREQNTEENMFLFLQTNFNNYLLKQELLDEKNSFFFAKVNNELAGYLKLSDSEAPTELAGGAALEIARIYCIKERIKQGIGKELIQFTIDFAKSHAKKVIWLGVWEHNERAIHFYQRFGFKKFGEHLFMVGHDSQTDWLMKLELL